MGPSFHAWDEIGFHGVEISQQAHPRQGEEREIGGISPSHNVLGLARHPSGRIRCSEANGDEGHLLRANSSSPGHKEQDTGKIVAEDPFHPRQRETARSKKSASVAWGLPMWHFSPPRRIIISSFVSILIWVVNVSVQTPRSRKLSASFSKSWTLLSTLLASKSSCTVTTNALISWVLTPRNRFSNVVSNKFCSVRFRLFFDFSWHTRTYFLTDPRILYLLLPHFVYCYRQLRYHIVQEWPAMS